MASNYTAVDPKAPNPAAVPAKPLGMKPLAMNSLKLICSSSLRRGADERNTVRERG
jgi:hypothetical protein